jgi:hypothetical protein
MNEYRTSIIWRLIISITYEIISVIYIVRLFMDAPSGELELILEWAPLFKYIFPSILMFSVSLLSLVNIVDALCLLLNSKFLKKRYIRITDERLVLIREKSGSKIFRVIIYMEVLITIIFGATDPVLFTGLLLNVMLITLVFIGFRAYYSIKLK